MEENKSPKLNNEQAYVEEDGVKLSRIIKVAVHRYVLLGIITAATCVIGTLALTLIKKPSESYKVEFDYSIPTLKTDSETKKLKLLDGSDFNYQQLLSKSNLTSIKEANAEEYKSIDVDKILDNSLTSISIKSKSDTDATKSTTTYVLVLPKSCFSNITQARNYAEAIAKTPITYNKNIVENYNYGSILKKVTNYYSYDDRLDCLLAQYEFLSERYEDLVTEYGATSIVTVGEEKESLATAYSSFLKDTDVTKIKSLKVIADENHYSVAKDGEFPEAEAIKEKISVLKNQNEVLSAQITAYNEEIQELTKQSQSGVLIDISKISAKLDSLVEEKSTNEYEIKQLSKKLYGTEEPTSESTSQLKEASEAFDLSVSNMINVLIGDTTNLKNIEAELLNNRSVVNYSTSSIVTLQNGVSLGKNIGLTLAGGFVLGCIVNLIVDRKYLKEEYPVKEKTQN